MPLAASPLSASREGSSSSGTAQSSTSSTSPTNADTPRWQARGSPGPCHPPGTSSSKPPMTSRVSPESRHTVGRCQPAAMLRSSGSLHHTSGWLTLSSKERSTGRLVEPPLLQLLLAAASGRPGCAAWFSADGDEGPAGPAHCCCGCCCWACGGEARCGAASASAGSSAATRPGQNPTRSCVRWGSPARAAASPLLALRPLSSRVRQRRAVRVDREARPPRRQPWWPPRRSEVRPVMSAMAPHSASLT